MANDELKALLEHMPEIAQAVNAFSSESAQRDALAALLAAYSSNGVASNDNAGDVDNPTEDTAESAESAPPQPPVKPTAKRQRKNGGSGSKDGFKFMKDLDLQPGGKQSFAAFVAEKLPKSNEDKFATAVYWFAHVAEVQPVTVHHIGSAFRFTSNWREPSDLPASLRVTAARKGTIDASKMEDLKTTPQGRNFVLHDLPAKDSAKK